MKRRIHINYGTNVQMYATESVSSSNPNNCADSCGSCSSGGNGGGAGDAMASAIGSAALSGGGDALLGAAVGYVVVNTITDPNDWHQLSTPIN